MTRYTLFTLIVILHFVAKTQSSFERLSEKGYSELIEGDIVAAKRDLEKARSILPTKLPLEDQAIFFNNLGVAHYQSGEYKQGINDYTFALESYRKLGNDSLIAESLHNLGLAYKEIGLYQLATKELLKSARTFEENDNLKELSSAWNAIGNIQRDLGNFEKALLYHRKALEIRTQIHYTKGIADSYHNIGYVYLDQQDYDKAQYYLEEALNRKRELGNQSNLITTLTLLGQVYLHKKESDKAFVYLNMAYDLRLSSGNSPKIAFSLFHLGNYYATIGNYQKAYSSYRQSEELAKTSNDLPLLLDALLAEIQLLRKDDNIKLLVKKYEELLQVQQKAALDANRKELARLEISYDVERKNRTIQLGKKQAKLDKIHIENQRLKNQQLLAWVFTFALIACVISIAFYKLRQQKKRIEQQNQALADQKSEIMHLHDELSHRTKNYFGLLSGILKTDKGRAQHKETVEVLNINIRRLEAMSMVHKYLLDDSAKRNKEIRLDVYFSELIDLIMLHLFPRGHELKLHKKIEIIYLDYDIAMRLAIVLNELLCNAIEHGLKTTKEPLLVVSIKQTGKYLQLIVQDNGTGISGQQLESTTKKGLGLIEKLLLMINGTILYKNENGCVATVEILI